MTQILFFVIFSACIEFSEKGAAVDDFVKQQFIETWGTMGSYWGINSSVARVHALLIVSEKPLSLDDVAEQLNISKGNASMCLKELRSWKVITKVSFPGDRKDYYSSLNDIWKMFFLIARERKRREFDPAMEILEKVISQQNPDEENMVIHRLNQMLELLKILDVLSGRFLQNDEEAKATLLLATNIPFGTE